MALHRRHLGFALSLVAATTAAQPQPELGAEVDAGFPTVITPTRLLQSLSDVPASVTVVTAEMLRLFGVRSIPDALRLVPGMAVTHATGPDYQISYHGTNTLSPRRMNVLIDGVSVYRPAFSEVVWSQLPVSIDDIERIEVTRGPSSATYGPNSMLAVVNIITFNASDVGLGHVSLTAGRRLSNEANVRLGLRSESAALSLTASRSVDRGFDRVKQDPAGHDSLAITRLGLRFDATLPGGDIVNARAMLARGVAEVPFIDQFQQSYPDRRFSDSYVSGSWQRDISPEHQLRVSIDSARQRNRQSWRTCLPTAALLPELFNLWQANPRYANAILTGQVPVGSGGSPRDDQLAVIAIGALQARGPEAALPRCGTTDQDATQFRTDIELQDTLVLSPELRIVTGVGWRHQGGESDTFLGGRQTSTVRWLFGNVEARPRPWLTLNVGGYVERNSLAPSSFSPRLAANWHLAPGHTVRASWSKGTRAPDIQEQLTNWTIQFRDVDPPLGGSSTARFYQSRIGPGSLSSERIVSREIGYLANLPTWGVILDARVFDDQLTGLISERTNLAGVTPTNAGAVKLRGAELQISGRLSAQWFGHATYGYLDNRNPTNILERTLWSRHSGSVGVSREFRNGWQLAGSYTGASGTGYQQSRYGRVDLVVSKAWKQDQAQWRITGGLQRLDRPVPPTRSAPTPPLRASTTVATWGSCNSRSIYLDPRCGGAEVRCDRRRLLGAAGLLATGSPVISRAQQGPEIRVLFDEASSAAANLVSALGGRFGRVSAVSDIRQLRVVPAPLFYVAIGAGSLAAAVGERLNAPLVSMLASRQAYERIAVGRKAGMTGIYAEPAPMNQMRLIRTLLRRRVTVGALISRGSVPTADVLREAATAHGLTLHAEVYEPDLGLSRNLLRIADATAVLAFPDAGVYTTQNLRELLEATYRRRQPVFGFSSALVAAGTLASAISEADDLAAQVAGFAPELAERRIPAPQYPRYWRVAVNESVARSLNVVVEPSVLRMGDRP